MLTNGEHSLVIFANGYGTRLRELTGGIPKTLLEIGGQPILARLLSAAAQIPHIRVIIYTRPEDEHIADFLNRSHFPCIVELRRLIPGGILPDYIRVSREIGREFSVFDSDLVAPLPELSQFLREAPGWSQNVPLIIGATAASEINYDRMLWLTKEDNFNFTITPQGGKGDFCFACAYHWRPMGLDEAEALISSRLSSFHDYMYDLSRRGCHVGCVRLSTAHNVNTPDLFAKAQKDVLAWQKLGLEKMIMSTTQRPSEA